MHLQIADRTNKCLSEQVLARLMAGTISRIWFYILMTDRRLPPMDNDERELWTKTASDILKGSIDNIESVALEMVNHVENVSKVADHNLQSTYYKN